MHYDEIRTLCILITRIANALAGTLGIHLLLYAQPTRLRPEGIWCLMIGINFTASCDFPIAW